MLRDNLLGGDRTGQLLLQHIGIDDQLMHRFATGMTRTVGKHHFARLVDIAKAQLWIEYQYRRTQAVQYLRGAFLVQHWLSFHGLNQCKNQTNSRLTVTMTSP